MISDVHFFERGSRKMLTILLEKKALRIPGILTLYPGRKIQLINDRFEDSDFDTAVELIMKYFSKESE